MDLALQIIILIFAIAYKFFLARNHILGWIFSMISGLSSLLYLFLYMNLPILMCLEGSGTLLAIYGIYKHLNKTTILTKVDISIISLTAVVIIILVFFQIRTNTTWYEVVSSAAFLGGFVLLAQKSSTIKIVGWALLFIGSLLYGKVMFDGVKYGILVVHVISMIIDIYAIIKIRKTMRRFI